MKNSIYYFFFSDVCGGFLYTLRNAWAAVTAMLMASLYMLMLISVEWGLSSIFCTPSPLEKLKALIAKFLTIWKTVNFYWKFPLSHCTLFGGRMREKEYFSHTIIRIGRRRTRVCVFSFSLSSNLLTDESTQSIHTFTHSPKIESKRWHIKRWHTYK